ncbi:AzlD domain-containing protein [Roseospira goensis]|uniref:Branched-subunit amino acid transport protein n=1 Tax=Roseospira goensis TaxID=391922 RepID=A0A7W6S016_9PROT|nr:AzlD domain-containing protein [Roseospira goensis]MBB4285895.1 branched-subunit amino acid transport protein [Roseospira goensis]
MLSGAADPLAVAAVLVGVTFVLRALPVVLLTRFTLPAVVDRWLRYAGDAVVVSFVMLICFFDTGTGRAAFDTAAAVALLCTGVLCAWTRGPFAGIAVGTAVYGLLTALGV